MNWLASLDWAKGVTILVGLFALIGEEIGTDIMQWSSWATTFTPQSVGKLIKILAAAAISYQAGKRLNERAALEEVAKRLLGEQPHVILPLDEDKGGV